MCTGVWAGLAWECCLWKWGGKESREWIAVEISILPIQILPIQTVLGEMLTRHSDLVHQVKLSLAELCIWSCSSTLALESCARGCRGGCGTVPSVWHQGWAMGMSCSAAAPGTVLQSGAGNKGSSRCRRCLKRRKWQILHDTNAEESCSWLVITASVI